MPAAAPTDDAVLVTGAAGFIGFTLARRLLEAGHRVVGVDNLSPYYDVRLKQARLEQLEQRPGFTFHRLDIADRPGMAGLFAEVKARFLASAPYPAWSAIGVHELALPGLLVEIKATAVV